MFKSARVPERLFRVLMWIVSIVFAGFLIALGGKILADLPRVDSGVRIEELVDQATLQRLNEGLRSVKEEQRPVFEQVQRATLAKNEAENAYESERESFDNWVATRRSTQNPAQDAELVSRTRKLDDLKQTDRRAQESLEALSRKNLEIEQRVVGLQSEREALLDAARAPFQRSQLQHELKIFGVRLAFTLPLLLIAGWFIARKRKSEYWPLMRGFVIAALFAFFVELVPYLPSYGGYIRYLVGILLTALVGHYGIRWMRGYLERRRVAEKANEVERRGAITYEEALKKMAVNVCPGCERPVTGKGGEMPDFCMHCGMNLLDDCGTCKTHKNAFFHYCPSCGSGKDVKAGGLLPQTSSA